MCPACFASAAAMVAGAGSAGGILAVCLGKFRKFFTPLLAMMPSRFRYPLPPSGWERTFTSKLPNIDGVAKKGGLKRPLALKLPGSEKIQLFFLPTPGGGDEICHRFRL